MLKKLAQIANRLDYLGLTKEADVVDRFILKMAQMEEVEDLVEPEMEDDSSKARVARAIEASENMGHFIGALRTRNQSSESEGSTFKEEQTAKSLKNADWKPYEHPDVKAPAVAFRAPIKGYFGIIELKDIDPETPVRIVKAHKGAETPDGTPIEAACIVPASKVPRPESNFTTILLGPGGDKEIVWTFFPGPPIAPSSMVWSEELEAEVTNAGEAIAAGYKYGKLGGS
jgi:hypothetical protein